MRRRQNLEIVSLRTSGTSVTIDGCNPCSNELASLQQLGACIRGQRLRHQQLHTDRPWAQEDLAVAIGSDKSHINRIECGRQLPSHDTLERICDALGLLWEERRQLLGLAGYLFTPPPPAISEVESAILLVSPLLHAAGYPVGLVDHEQKLWEVNELLAYAFFGYPTREACLAETRGMRAIDLLSLNHPAGWWLRQVLVDYESFARRHVALFRSVYRHREHASQNGVHLANLLSDWHLRSIWLDSRNDPPNHPRPSFLDHQFVEVDHPEVGRYSVQLWQSRLARDDRFSVLHLLPNGERTRRLFATLAVHLRRRSSVIIASRSSSSRSQAQPRPHSAPRGLAAGFPTRPISLMVPWPAGGTTDVGARIVAAVAEKELGQPIVVVNKEGAGSRVGLAELARQEPDGHHLGFINVPAFNTSILSPGQKSPFGVNSFTFIINQVYDPTAVFVRADSPYRNLQQLLEDARRRPHEIVVGTSGWLTPAHLGSLLLERVADISFRFIHFEGSAEHTARFFGGETDVAFFTLGITLPAVRSRKLRALAIYTKERSVLLPDVPTAVELGHPTLIMASTRGIAGPRGVSRRVAQKLESVFRASMEKPEHIQQMESAGFGIKLLVGEEYSKLVYRQERLYRDLIPQLTQPS
jgi:tripartite-type tricarboxylate transporter receptor subunit TctC/transcriptional regulator with XRE-family HTH domain